MDEDPWDIDAPARAPAVRHAASEATGMSGPNDRAAVTVAPVEEARGISTPVKAGVKGSASGL